MHGYCLDYVLLMLGMHLSLLHVCAACSSDWKLYGERHLRLKLIEDLLSKLSTNAHRGTGSAADEGLQRTKTPSALSLVAWHSSLQQPIGDLLVPPRLSAQTFVSQNMR